MNVKAASSHRPFSLQVLPAMAEQRAELLNTLFYYLPDGLQHVGFLPAVEGMLTEFFPSEYETIHEIEIEGEIERTKGKMETFSKIFDQSEITLGRRKDNDLQIKDVFVSSKHAMIYRIENQYQIADLHSANKTKVGGKIVKPGSDVALQDGDDIQLGNTRLKIRIRTKRLLQTAISIKCKSLEQYLFSEWRHRLPQVSVLVRIGLVPFERRAILELDTELCLAIYERLLGGIGATTRLHRPLTEIEEGAVKYILLKVIDTITTGMGPGAKFTARLVDIVRSPAPLTEDFQDNEPVAVFSFHIALGHRATYSRLVLPIQLLERQDLVIGPKSFSDTPREREFIQTRAQYFADAQITLPVWLGAMPFTVNEWNSLKPTDTIMLDDIPCQITPDRAALSGKAHAFLGNPNDGGFYAMLQQGPDGQINIELGDLFKKGEVRMGSDNKEPRRIEGQEAIDLNETAKIIIHQASVPVSIELGRIRMNLAELLKLRKGQVLNLGKTPSDLVDLVLAEDEKLIARGILLNMDGKFAVQLVEVLGQP